MKLNYKEIKSKGKTVLVIVCLMGVAIGSQIIGTKFYEHVISKVDDMQNNSQNTEDMGSETSVESTQVENKKVQIVLDSGHGGSDPGMIGIDGLEEKNINLSMTLLLKEKLEEKGYTVVLTREEDKGLYDESAQNKKAQDLQQRIALIDETAPALTVSIHQNSYHDPAVKGQ
mgnify:CR=1 FL=1